MNLFIRCRFGITDFMLFVLFALLVNPGFCLASDGSGLPNDSDGKAKAVPVLNLKSMGNLKPGDVSISPDNAKTVVSFNNYIYEVDLKTAEFVKLKIKGNSIQKAGYSQTGKYLGVIDEKNEQTGYYDFTNSVFYTPLKGKAYYKLNSFLSFSDDDCLVAIAYTKRNPKVKKSYCSEDADYYFSIYNTENAKEISSFKCPLLSCYSQTGLSGTREKANLYFTSANNFVQVDIKNGNVLNKQRFTEENVFCRYLPAFVNNCRSIFCLWKYNIPNTQKIRTIFCLSDIVDSGKIRKITKEKFRVKSFKVSSNSRYVCLYGCNSELNPAKKCKYYFLVLDLNDFDAKNIKKADPDTDNPHIRYDIASSGKFIIYTKGGVLYKSEPE